MYKLEKIFQESTANTNGEIKDQQQLDNFANKLLERKVIIEQDRHLFNIHIKDFPISFEQLMNYIITIYKLEIEKTIQHKITEHENTLTHIIQFLDFLRDKTNNKLNAEDICKILDSFLQNRNSIESSLTNFNKCLFIINSIHDDIKKFLWEKIYETMENKGKDFYEKLDILNDNPSEYQFKMQEKIQEEYEIIRVKGFNPKENIRLPENRIKTFKKISIEEARCADRNIPIWVYKVPNTYYDKNILESFYFQCEATRELLLSKYFQKFIGFDDISSKEFQFYFYEFIAGEIKLIPFFKSVDAEDLETSFFFRYIAKEILQAFRDLLNKCTYSFKFPITCENFYYDKSNLRLYFQNLTFGPRRKSIMDSPKILEAKMLYFYGLIILNLLSIKYPGLEELIQLLNDKCKNLEEFGKMQCIFDYIEYIENIITKNLKNDELICILIECLLSPYKAKIVFDEFYEKKNFLEEAKQSRLDKYNKDNNSEDNKNIKNSINNSIKNKNDKKTEIIDNKFIGDKETMLLPYFINNEKNEKKNEDSTKDCLTINKLLIHPFYSEINLTESFLKYLFKTEAIEK
jgi:hypothetical protein